MSDYDSWLNGQMEDYFTESESSVEEACEWAEKEFSYAGYAFGMLKYRGNESLIQIVFYPEDGDKIIITVEGTFDLDEFTTALRTTLALKETEEYEAEQ